MRLVELVEDLSGLGQFLQLPEFKPALDYYGGRMIQKMSPKLRHSILQGKMYLKLFEHTLPERLGEAFLELRCTFGKGSYVFDLSFFARDRVPKPDADDERADVTTPPDLVIEILSPGQAEDEVKKKIRSAIRGGVRLGWLMNPSRKRVLILQPKHKPEILESGDLLTGKVVLPKFTLAVDEIFGWLDQG